MLLASLGFDPERIGTVGIFEEENTYVSAGLSTIERNAKKKKEKWKKTHKIYVSERNHICATISILMIIF